MVSPLDRSHLVLYNALCFLISIFKSSVYFTMAKLGVNLLHYNKGILNALSLLQLDVANINVEGLLYYNFFIAFHVEHLLKITVGGLV